MAGVLLAGLTLQSHAQVNAIGFRNEPRKG